LGTEQANQTSAFNLARDGGRRREPPASSRSGKRSNADRQNPRTAARPSRPQQARCALSNLLDNAIKFTQHGRIRVESESNGRGLELHVIDTGCGIAPEHQSQLFREFFQIDNTQRDRKKGFGLGLAISRRLARQMGGDVVVESAAGQGSRFSILLPAAVDAPASSQSPHASATPVLAKG
jgi:signal transduction histidine kinase